MQLQVKLLNALPAHAAHHSALALPAAHPVVAQASLGIPDTLAIFVVALVVFGPKRLPEIGKQIGKLVFEFRRASNDFKLQIEEELRMAEQQDRQKVIDMQAAANQPATPVALSAESTTSAETAEAGPASVPGAMNSSEPQPPDRRAGEFDGSELTSASFNTEPTASALTTPVDAPEPEPSAPLTVQPPSTGTLVSALPPNHQAKNAMTAIPPPSGAPQATAESATPSADVTTHHG